MITMIYNMPRIGKNRELKKALESYWQGNIDAESLKEVAVNIIKENHRIIERYNIDISADGYMSYYDRMLDLATAFNIIPQRFLSFVEKNENLLDVYFAMARGVKAGKDVIYPLQMKKWFNTNYHYIVPEIEKNTNMFYQEGIFEWQVFSDSFSIIGPFSFLELSYIEGEVDENLIENLTQCYIDMIESLIKKGISRIIFEEPALVISESKEKADLLKLLYKRLSISAVEKIVISYFEDLAEIYYNTLMESDIDAIGLDLVEGKSNIDLIEKYGVSENKTIVAGVVNGRNVWVTNFERVRSILNRVLRKGINVIITTSCPLMHVPVTIETEDLPSSLEGAIAFAYEKVRELNIIKKYLKGDYSVKGIVENRADFLFLWKSQTKSSPEMLQKIEEIKKSSYRRNTPRGERLYLQRRELNIDVLPTTTIGSFPQDVELRRTRAKYRRGEIKEEEYDKYIKRRIEECVRFQEEIGIDILVHGEFERTDMVEYFASRMEGFYVSNNGWVLSYGSRCIKPPIIYGDIKAKEPITLKYTKYAQSLTTRPLKGMLTGPLTILKWSFPREDLSLEDIAYQIAMVIKEEIHILEREGIKIIQIDEPAFKESFPIKKQKWEEFARWAVNCFNYMVKDISTTTQIHTHMCYSNFEDVIEYIEKMDVDVMSIEYARSKPEILEVFKQYSGEIGPGVYDVHSPTIPSIEYFEEKIGTILKNIPYERVWINPDCGLKTRRMSEVSEALKNMVEATKNIRMKIKNEKITSTGT